MYTLSLLFISVYLIRHSNSAVVSYSNWSNTGYEYSPIDLDALLVSPSKILESLLRCTLFCHSNYRCRTLDYDTSSKRCRIFQGDMTTGRIISSNSSTSTVGSIILSSDNFIEYNQSCDQCSNNRNLICLNGKCQCHPYTYWNGDMCLPQLFYGTLCTQSNMCRADLNLTCLSQFEKCARMFDLFDEFKKKSLISVVALSTLAGITISGNSDCTTGSNMSALDGAETVFVSPFDGGSVYIADNNNFRILKFAPNSSEGTLVAGGNGGGSASNQIDNSIGIYVDAHSNIYAGEYFSRRIQLWPANATQGYTIASPSYGTVVTDITVDSNGYIYAAVTSDIQRFAPNTTSGVSTAGNATLGNTLSQLNGPHAIDLDEARSLLYVADTGNNRIQLFHVNSSTSGTTIGGFGGQGTGLNQLNDPCGVKFSRKTGHLYIADTKNHRILRYAPNATSGVVLFGTTGIYGCDPYLLKQPHRISLNIEETYLYVADTSNNRVQRFNLI